MSDATPARTAVLRGVADRILGRDLPHPVRVGIDGVCGVGKSTFARGLATALGNRGRPVIHLDSDGFHHVRERRYSQGRDSARGYYEDGYDFAGLADLVLRPLGPGGSFQYATKIHDLATDAVVTDQIATAPADAVVLFDATFLQRGSLRELWDEVVFLDADEGAALERGIARDAEQLGGADAARAAYAARYMAACRIYLAEERPQERASILLDHTDPHVPSLVALR